MNTSEQSVYRTRASRACSSVREYFEMTPGVASGRRIVRRPFRGSMRLKGTVRSV